MSIRYTLRHNIPSDKLAEEDVNDSSTWDLNLLRKHELAETDNHDIVYRKHNGEVVNWAEAATQQANDILGEVQDLSAHIDNQADAVQVALQTVQGEVATLTEEAEQANEAAQTALVQAELAVTESQDNANSANENSIRSMNWAIKTDGLVDDVDYSSKYYAQQAGASASSASSSASTATSAKNNAQTSATNASNSATLAEQWATKTDGKVDSTDYSAKHYALSCIDSATSASQSATDAATSASTATTKASQASTSASTATTKASEASASATSASNSASTATTKASEASASASSASQSATSAASSASVAEDAKDVAEAIAEQIDLVNKLIVYDNIVDMSEDISLQSGQTAQTKGQYTINDGKPSLYTIRDREQSDVDDRYNIVFLDNGKTAERVGSDTSDFLPLSGGTLTGNVYTTPYYDSTIVDPEGGQTLVVCKGKVAKGTAPSNNEYHTMAMAVDNSGSTNNAYKYGQVETDVKTDGSVETIVQAYKNEANSTTSAKITVGYDANGNVFTSAPTPTAGDSSTKIATTAFVNTAMANGYLPLSGGTMTGTIKKSGDVIQGTDDTLTVRINGGTTYSNGSFLMLYGKSNASYGGYFYLRASDGTNIKDLHGRPDGTLTWGTKNIERVYASGTNYIRYESGLQICWGDLPVSGSAVSDATATLPQAFKSNTSYSIVTGRFWAYSKDENYIVKSMTATNFVWSTIGTITTNSHSYRYIAIGFWK